ncbi:MAG TPA: RES family NAD+ phosphorylase [Rhizomicrobium sp.]
MLKLLCSNCLKNEGLRLNAWLRGSDTNSLCKNCGSENGRGLDRNQAMNLVQDFFVRGTVFRGDYGAAPQLVFNEHHAGMVEQNTPEDLVDDVQILSQYLSIGIFYYGPRAWMLGENYPLNSLRTPEERDDVIERIISEYPSRLLPKSSILYRVRINSKSTEYSEFDTAPSNLIGNGRFDTSEFPVLYVSEDLEGCVHECRATMDDEIHVASLQPNKDINILDLSGLYLEDGKNEFDSLDMAVHMLFAARKHAYPITRAIGLKAFERGYDGIQYPSYFSHVRTGTVPFETAGYGISVRRFESARSWIEANTAKNIAIFGRPIADNLLRVKSINRVVIRRVSYDLSFGPVGY